MNKLLILFLILIILIVSTMSSFKSTSFIDFTNCNCDNILLNQNIPGFKQCNYKQNTELCRNITRQVNYDPNICGISCSRLTHNQLPKGCLKCRDDKCHSEGEFCHGPDFDPLNPKYPSCCKWDMLTDRIDNCSYCWNSSCPNIDLNLAFNGKLTFTNLKKANNEYTSYFNNKGKYMHNFKTDKCRKKDLCKFASQMMELRKKNHISDNPNFCVPKLIQEFNN